MVAQIGFSTCFSEHVCMASSYVSKWNIFKTFCWHYEAFSKRNCESPRMIAAIVWPLPLFTQFRKYAVDDIIPILTRLKKCGSELKLLVSIFRKLYQINQLNQIKSRKVATFENCEIFSTLYFSYVRDYKATLSGVNL